MSVKFAKWLKFQRPYVALKEVWELVILLSTLNDVCVRYFGHMNIVVL